MKSATNPFLPSQPEKRPRPNDWTTYRRLLSYLRGTQFVMLALLACMVFEALFTAASIGMTKPLIDLAMDRPIIAASNQHPAKATDSVLDKMKFQIRQRFEPVATAMQQKATADPAYKFKVLLYIVGGMLAFGFMMVVASFGTGYLSAYLATRTVQKLRNHVFQHVVSLDMAFFNNHSTGSLMSLVIQDVQAVDGSLDVLFTSVIKNPIKIMFFVAMMIFISPLLTLVTFLVIPIIGVIIYILGRRVRRVSQRIQKAKAMLSSILEEAFTGMRVIKGYNMEDIETRRFEKKTRDVFKMGLKTTSAEELGSGLTQFLGLGTVALVVLIGTYFVVVRKELDAGSFVVFAALLTQVFRPLKGASKVSSRIQKGLAGCDRVFAVLDSHPKVTERPGARTAGPLKHSLQFNDVQFAYSKSKEPALKGINLTIPAGAAVALIGETGSGKSTLANLVPRFYDPTAGSITYDSTDLRELEIRSLRDQIALVTQEVVLFDDTVSNNIAYGTRGKVSAEQIIDAAKAARAHEFIMRMPQGYETAIGSRGARLSGGERQRLAIARAILKDAPILILDEATSALDSETEALIQEALSNLIKGRTTIVIAHRLSTIQSCDRIYVMDHGRVIEEGTHAELLGNEGRYARFHQIQFAIPHGS